MPPTIASCILFIQIFSSLQTSDQSALPLDWKYRKCSFKVDSADTHACSLATPRAIKFQSSSLLDCAQFCDMHGDPRRSLSPQNVFDSFVITNLQGTSTSYISKSRWAFPAFTLSHHDNRFLNFSNFIFHTPTSPPIHFGHIPSSYLDVSTLGCISFNYEKSRQVMLMV